MELLGDWNWYFPSWLEWLPRINIEGARQPARPAEVAPAGAIATVQPVMERAQDAVAAMGTQSALVSTAEPDDQPNGFSVWKLLRRIGLAVVGVIVLAGALGGTTVGLAVTGGPGSCQAGGGPIVVNAANAEAFHRKWDAFNAALASGKAASVTFSESEVNSRLNAWNDEKDIFREVRVCIHDGYGEATGKLGWEGIEGAFKITGTVDLTGQHAVVHVDDIDLGNVPDTLLEAFKGRAENPIEEALDKYDASHSYKMTYAEGEVRIDGQP